MITIITNGSHSSANLKIAKLLLQHMQATPGLVGDVDEFLARAAGAGWPDLCRVLIVDGHANAQALLKRSSSGRLELKERCLEYRSDCLFPQPDEKVVETITACLPDEVLEAIAAEQETENELAMVKA